MKLPRQTLKRGPKHRMLQLWCRRLMRSIRLAIASVESSLAMEEADPFRFSSRRKRRTRASQEPIGNDHTSVPLCLGVSYPVRRNDVVALRFPPDLPALRPEYIQTFA
jgi:hypothetical protein